MAPNKVDALPLPFELLPIVHSNNFGRSGRLVAAATPFFIIRSKLSSPGLVKKAIDNNSANQIKSFIFLRKKKKTQEGMFVLADWIQHRAVSEKRDRIDIDRTLRL